MTVDWANFTPWASLGGGIVLGLAAAIFILFNGRILGISGILGGLMSPRMGDIGWRLSFLLGMAAASLLLAAGFNRWVQQPLSRLTRPARVSVQNIAPS